MRHAQGLGPNSITTLALPAMYTEEAKGLVLRTDRSDAKRCNAYVFKQGLRRGRVREKCINMHVLGD